jgi:hypothetical protein
MVEGLLMAGVPNVAQRGRARDPTSGARGEKGWLVSGAVHRVLIYFRTEIQHRQRERDLHEGTIPSPFRFHKT